jgi:tetratricopeptide (TPR) repeat protein
MTEDGLDQKIAFQATMLPLMERAGFLMLESQRLKYGGDLEATYRALSELQENLDRQISITVEHNARFAGDQFVLEPLVSQSSNNLLELTDICVAVARFDEAEQRALQAAQLIDAFMQGPQHADRQRQMASLRKAQGRFNEALTLLNEARDVLDETHPLGSVQTGGEIADILEWLGDDERALAEIARSKARLERLTAGRRPTQAHVQGLLAEGRLPEAEQAVRVFAAWMQLTETEARIRRHRGDFAEARTLLGLVRAETMAAVLPAVDFQLAMTDLREGNHEAALSGLRALVPQMTGLLAPKLGVAQAYQVPALLALGDPAEAVRVAELGVANLRPTRDVESLWRAQHFHAQALAVQGRKREALQVYLASADSVARLRRAPLGRRLDSTYLAEKLPVFEEGMLLAGELQDGVAGCRLMEFVKARTLTAILTAPRPAGATGQHPLERRVDALSSRLAALEFRSHSSGSSPEREAAVQMLLQERANLVERVRVEDPRWRAMTEPVPFHPQALLDRLRPGRQAAVSLYWHEGQITAVLLYQGQIAIASQPVAPDLERSLDAYACNLGSPTPDPVLFDPAAFPALAAEAIIPRCLLARAVGAASLIVAPHRDLHLLPFPALMHDRARLFERCPVGIVPNLSCLELLHQPLVREPRIALLGPPDYAGSARFGALPTASLERDILKAVYGRSRVLEVVEKEVTRQAFVALAQRPDAQGVILHAICHGQVDPEPLSSGLELADGRMNAGDIARLRMRHEEVVLPACSLGQRPSEVEGVKLLGDDILGIPAAFMEAGVRSTLVSIPPVEDMVAVSFMGAYHKGRCRGETPLQALQSVQKAALTAGRHDPGLWAGFIIYGCQ